MGVFQHVKPSYICHMKSNKTQIMKNLTKNTRKGFLMLALIATSLSFANETSFYSIKDDAKKTELTLTNVKAGNELTIKDTYGTILYTEQIKKSGNYVKGFDFTLLPDGAYVFELDKDLEIKTIPFTKTNKNIVINKGEETSSFKPYFKQQNDFLFISKLSPDMKAVKISIYADNNNDYSLLLNESIKGNQTVERIYKLEKGNYKIVVNSDNKVFTKFITN